MFNSEFFPTPYSLLERIETDFSEIWSTLPEGISILEPSAGKGDIVDWLKRRQNTTYYGHKGTLRFSSLDIDCVEIDKELSATLKGKGLYVVHNDFLHFETMKRYDLIFMNPPFSNGDAHLRWGFITSEEYEIIKELMVTGEKHINEDLSVQEIAVKILDRFIENLCVEINIFENEFINQKSIDKKHSG